MNLGILDWLNLPTVKRAACRNGYARAVERAMSINSDEDFYTQSDMGSDFLFGITYRQPDIALEIVSDLARKLYIHGLPVEFINAYEVAVVGARIESMQQQLQVVEGVLHKLGAYRYLDRIASGLLRWRLGLSTPIKVAYRLGGHIEKHGRCGGVKVDLPEELKKRIPFEVWKHGLPQ